MKTNTSVLKMTLVVGVISHVVSVKTLLMFGAVGCFHLKVCPEQQREAMCTAAKLKHKLHSSYHLSARW